MDHFTASDVALAQAALREALGLEPERLGVHQVGDMLMEEIRDLQAAGFTTAAIAKIIADSTGKAISGSDLDHLSV